MSQDVINSCMEIVKAQASVRTMSADEMASMVETLVTKMNAIHSGTVATLPEPPAVGIDPKNAIREKSVICMECGKSFKVLTKRHLATHSLTPEEYKEKWGYKKGTSLVAKSLARDRRKTMQGMKLWEKRKKAGAAATPEA